MTLQWTMTASERGRIVTVVGPDNLEQHVGAAADLAFEILTKNSDISHEEFIDLLFAAPLRPAEVFANYGRVEEREDGTFTIDGRALPSAVSDVVERWCAEGRDLMPVVRFVERMFNAGDPDHTIEVVDRWLLSTGMQIQEDGRIVGYKGLGTDNRSVRGGTDTVYVNGRPQTGRILQHEGDVVSIAREDVDPDPDHTCSHGLHVGSKDYATAWGELVMVVAVDPADIVAIPSDYQGQKMRTTRYEILDVFDPEADYEPPSRLAVFIEKHVPARLQRFFHGGGPR